VVTSKVGQTLAMPRQSQRWANLVGATFSQRPNSTSPAYVAPTIPTFRRSCATRAVTSHCYAPVWGILHKDPLSVNG